MKIGIIGYGNLGKALERGARLSSEFEIVGIFSRRNIKAKYAKVFNSNTVFKYENVIDCLLLAGGSSHDLPVMSPALAKKFNIVDSFDRHSEIKEHFDKVNASALAGNHSAIVSCGWDPGLFSIMRLFGKSFLNDCRISSFWGRGVSQGHSEAIRKIDGVKYAIQYTVPKTEAINEALAGKKPENAKEAHIRECYVVADSAKQREIEEEIRNIPEYFKGYETHVNFISESEFLNKHQRMFHGGRVISFGETGGENKGTAIMDFQIKMDSNPDFTAGIMLAYARAVKRLYDMKNYGAKTPFHVPPYLLLENAYFDLL